MASFKFDGIDTISFESAAQMSDEDKLAVIMPAAELLKARHSEAIQQTFSQRTGVLAGSIDISVRTGESGSSAFVAPTGKHPGSSTGKRMKKIKGSKKRRASGRYSGTNMEIAYILEYGSPRITATHWMENANEKAEPEVNDAMQNAFDDVLKKKGLI